jgi:hypothetical protein
LGGRHCERSEAIQRERLPPGLLRRFAARNDDPATNRANQHEQPVIASAAKQSRENAPRLDCFAASRLAMTTLPRTARTNTNALRHCERSEAIQCEGLPRLDCFVALRLAMTTLPRTCTHFVRTEKPPPLTNFFVCGMLLPMLARQAVPGYIRKAGYAKNGVVCGESIPRDPPPYRGFPPTRAF